MICFKSSVFTNATLSDFEHGDLDFSVRSLLLAPPLVDCFAMRLAEGDDCAKAFWFSLTESAERKAAENDA